MLAAMPPTPPPTPEPGERHIRDRGDACPGALRLHSADDGRLARLRLPGGRLTSRQVEILADATENLGDGRLSITSRGNAELRGLADDCGAELAALLDEAGLLPSPTHERVRNIVASPASGLDGLGTADVQLWARELDTHLRSAPWAAALSGRFLFVLDDGRGDVAGLGGDVTLVAVGGGEAELHVGGRAVRLASSDAPSAALAVAGGFLAAARKAGTGAWRVRELPEEYAVDMAESGVTARPVAAPELPQGPPPAPGVLGPGALSVLAPLGRLTAAQLRALLPAEEVRLTPWRGVVVAGTDPGRLPLLDAAGLITRPDSPWAGVTACTGRPGCAKSLADVRADAAPGCPGHPGHPGHLGDPGQPEHSRRPGHPGPAERRPAAPLLPVHFSGCERRCGHPHGAWTDVLATVGGDYLVDGVPTPRTALPEAVTAARTTR
ncbi:cobalamin biosynthesis protein CobG [Streptomyces sp. CB02009]|uniref:cobalamin biosynthesis protein CobG n=1 Tax=Streptomyces sp. CB02009 TaxID=1703938 RepID=UPI00093AF1E1|nr:cobalamin biosynthesis protein CobG [Streptomyces sp. CB02009]OKJ61288.1 cobalamin biosynthesis protein CobG [Streptomyces sp. CB02009]